MKELNDMQVSYDEALASFQDIINDTHRQWAARLLRSYPHRCDLALTAEALREDLSSRGVEVNSIVDSNQESLVRTLGEATRVPQEESLCVLTVGLGESVQVADTQGGDFLEGHPVLARGLRSWASAPIVIEGVSAGTICALETEQPRNWGPDDQALLEKAAAMISRQVEHWAQSCKYKI